MQRSLVNDDLLRLHGISHMPDSEMDNHKMFVVGNDPHMGSALDPYHEPNDQIALIATSGVRCLSIAGKLGNQKKCPQIVLIDYNSNVYTFWMRLKSLFQLHTDVERFLAALPQFMRDNSGIYINMPENIHELRRVPKQITYLNQNVLTYFKSVFQKYDYGFIREIVLNTINIKQDWQAAGLLPKIQKMLKEQGISKLYVYASNIIGCMDGLRSQRSLLENIHAIKPVLCIHTSRSDKYKMPKYYYLLTNSEPDYALRQILPKEMREQQHSFQNVDELFSFLSMFAAGRAHGSPQQSCANVQPRVEIIEDEPDFAERDSAIARIAKCRSDRASEGYFRGFRFIKFGEKAKLDAADALIDLLRVMPANTSVASYLKSHIGTLNPHLKSLTEGELGDAFFAISGTTKEDFVHHHYQPQSDVSYKK